MTIYKRLTTRAVGFASDTSGTIAIVFGLVIVILVCCVGVAIDFGRAESASAQVADTLDEAALAATESMVDEATSDTAVSGKIASFLNGTIGNPRLQGANFSGLKIATDTEQGSIAIDVDVHVPTVFTRLFNAGDISFHKFAKTAYKVKNVELAMVLDTTGSMNDFNKINELKSAAAQAIDILMPPGKPVFNRIALAPFAASVNAGPIDLSVSAGASTDGCVVERQGPNAYTDATASGPDPLLTSSNGSNGNYSCPAQAIMPLSKNPLALKAAINGFTTGGGTAGHIGLAWGWYLISPQWAAMFPPVSAPKPYTDPKAIKAVLLMTDGMFNTSYFNGAINTTSAAQAISLCDGIKAAGIRIYTVGLELALNPSPDDVNARTLLGACASPDGSGGSEFYDVANGANLGEAFSKIAGKLSRLRLSN